MKIILSLSFLFFCPGIFAQQQNIYFGTDQFDISVSSQHILEHWLAKNPTAVIDRIFGYCDSRGTDAYNDTLSVKRAKTIFEFLAHKKAVFSKDFEIQGLGENFDPSGRLAENRKVIIFYTIPKPGKLATDISSAQIGDKIKLDNLYFFNLSDRIVPESRQTLSELLAVLENNSNIKIEIQGHICCQTAHDTDYSYISTARAKAIYNYLIANGIASDRLSYKGFGVSRPIHPIPEKTPKEEDENRRVEIEVISN
jgi:outer membrane protein OmpA-like peptidoglycan-associated protein